MNEPRCFNLAIPVEDGFKLAVGLWGNPHDPGGILLLAGDRSEIFAKALMAFVGNLDAAD